MFYYKFAEKINQDNLKKLVEQVPAQAGAILVAVWNLGKNETAVSEDQIIDHIQADIKTYSPRAKGPEVVPGFVAYYRQMLGKLPEHILVQTKDNLGGKARGRAGGGVEHLIDPITGEKIENVFKRPPTKNPGSRKTRKIVTEEILEDDGEEMPELEEAGAESAEEEVVS